MARTRHRTLPRNSLTTLRPEPKYGNRGNTRGKNTQRAGRQKQQLPNKPRRG